MPKSFSASYFLQGTKIVEKWLAYQRYELQIPGMSVGIFSKDDGPVFLNYGFANERTAEKADENTNYRIASISKFFTATAIMMLREKNKIKLDDRLGDYFEYFDSKKSNLSLITVKQLLSHFSGLTRDGSTPHWYDSIFPTAEELVNQVKSAGRKSPVSYFLPSSQFKYSNFGFGIAGLLIEKVTAQPYAEFLRKEIFQKLGMKRTFVDYEGDMKGLATGYSRAFPGKKRIPFDHAQAMGLSPAAGLVSNTKDLCKFLRTFLDEKESSLLSEPSKNEMKTKYWMKDNASVGYGLGMLIWKMNDRYVFGHTGGYIGFVTIAAFDPKSGVGVTMLTNAQDTPITELLEGVLNIYQNVKEREERSLSRGSYLIGRRSQKDRRPFTRYEGGFSSRWADIEFVSLENKKDEPQLLALALNRESRTRPLENAMELQYNGRNKFTVACSSQFDHMGESIVFDFKNAKERRKSPLPRVLVGPNPMTFVKDGELWKNMELKFSVD